MKLLLPTNGGMWRYWHHTQLQQVSTAASLYRTPLKENEPLGIFLSR